MKYVKRSRRSFLTTLSVGIAGLSGCSIAASNEESGQEYPPNGELYEWIKVRDSTELAVRFDSHRLVSDDADFPIKVEHVGVARGGELLARPKRVLLGAAEYSFALGDVPDGHYRVVSQGFQKDGGFGTRDAPDKKTRRRADFVSHIRPFEVVDSDVVLTDSPRTKVYRSWEGYTKM